VVITAKTQKLAYLCGACRRCPTFNGLNLYRIYMDALVVDDMPKKLYDANPKVTFRELSIQFFFFE
jgi:hypothetical protein